jgi:hypothetical protein
MRHALTKLLSEDHQSLETRRCKRRNNNERPKYQTVHASFSSAAFFFDSVFAAVRAELRLKRGFIVTSFYGNNGAKFRDKSDSIAASRFSDESRREQAGNKAAHGSLNSPVCSCVSITLPAAS